MAMPVNTTYAGDYAKPSLSVVKQTAFTSARDTFNDVHRLENRIETIVNSLVGYPTQGHATGESPAEPEACGVFHGLSQQANSAANAISRANEALDRLEREF